MVIPKFTQDYRLTLLIIIPINFHRKKVAGNTDPAQFFFFFLSNA